MSGEPKSDEPAEPTADASGVIPVEVEAPDEAAGPDDLEQKLAAAEKEKKDNWDRHPRSAADLENLRKSKKREIDGAKIEAKQRVLKEILPVVDNLERAIEHAGSGAAGSAPI